ncbi:Helicase [Gracilaria domingensis]|nr:Helicase [Gracilaria domingensis]
MPPTENRRSGRKRRTPARLAEQPPDEKRPRKEPKSRTQDVVQNVSDVHKPCDQLLFLAHTRVLWKPPRSDYKTLKCLENIHVRRSGNLHSYFITSQAAKEAARASDRICMYRHVGELTLDKVRFSNAARSADCVVQSKFPYDRSQDHRLNFVEIIDTVKCANTRLLRSLESLAFPDTGNWNVPYIVLLAEHQHVVDAINSRKKLNLTLQVYTGRMLFELIACDDIKTLFEALNPTHPFKPVPTLPQFPASFPRSDLSADTSDHSCEAILQRAESTGYQSLSDNQRHKIETTLNVTLFPFQEQTVRWMLDKENDQFYLNDYFWEERSFTKTNGKDNGSYFYFPLTGEVRLNRPPRMRGGMVTEEMGLGKTIEALALIAAQREKTKLIELDVQCPKRPNDFHEVDGVLRMKRLKAMNKEQPFSEHIFHHGDKVRTRFLERSFPQKVTVTRWTPQTTLVICPSSLLGQWRQEAVSKAPSLSIYVWGEEEEVDDDEEDEEYDRSLFAIGESAVDIVLTTYATVRKDPLLSMITWRRVILDEAQLTRRSSTQIARDMFNLRSNTRFLMTGTPVVGSLDDFKGELATLKIWPFTLENDGFWEKHVLQPMREEVDTSLLSSLLDVTMIRHTKGQGLHLSLPERKYETIEVDLVGSHRSCYCYILAIALEELDSQLPGEFDSRRLRLLLRFLLWVSLSPSLVDVANLDIARRHIWARGERLIHGARGDDEDPEMRQLSGRKAIEFVASATSGIVRQTLRTFAMGSAAPSASNETANVLEVYLHMPLSELRKHVIHNDIAPRERVPHLQRERLAALAAGGVHRLATDTLQELRDTAIRVGVVTSDQAKKLTRSSAMAKLQTHYDRENGIQVRTVHESGFVALTKLIEGKGNPTCPICLTECDDRVTVTKCGHLYCHGCMSLVLSTKDSHGYYRKPKCAICRRDLTQSLVAEIIRNEPDPPPSASNDEIKREVLAPKPERSKESKTKTRRGRRRTSRRAATVAPEVQDESRAPEFVMPTASEAWAEYSQLGEAPDRFRHITQSSAYPSIDASFLQHLQSARHGLESPKLAALLSLIQSRPRATKFCVVAGSITSLGVVNDFLKKHNIKCVGVGVHSAPQRGRKKGKEMTNASEAFSTDPSVRVFLLNPGNSSGLNLIAAEYVVFLETLVRVADEIQAAARVHRIGQTKNVKIVRIVARNTIDEQIAWDRREASTPAQESQIMASSSHRDASDSLILRLFGHVLQQG